LPRRIGIVLALLMIGTAGFAQNSGNVFVGYSYNRASTGWSNTGHLDGWEVSAEGKIAPFAGLVADVGTQYGTLQIPNQRLFGIPGPPVNSGERAESYLFGVRLSHSMGKFEPFAQGLVGAAHLHENATEFAYGETSLADAIDGGFDYHLRPRVAWRLQVNVLQTRFHGGTQTDEGISTGPVLHF
jgi:hypothetical protein